ncbi:hypothetical protein FB45DRAFT_932474 [Roridomyces roridus]|uniref:Uncharacterized protein n=1 Tax=Roridomyces roridus TaxID=1738132 RepID=A0AAD7BF70_9AGAR|nr:hypothetical protein FB45DRAFT_932474 [Roridomyces roridus]
MGLKASMIKYIHKVRSLDCDTTFKPVAGKTNIFEINGWMPGINKELTLGRVWMSEHDRRTFQFVWEEFMSLVKRLTNQSLTFTALHRGGTLLGVNADMEAAPLLGMADALLQTINIPSVAEQIKTPAGVIKKTVRACYSHVKRGLPDLSHLSLEDRDRIKNFMYIETVEEVEVFKVWIRTVADPTGIILRWWEHKEMHEWILPSIIQCLSHMDADIWHIMEATSNFGEAQHSKNNLEAGTGIGLVQSFIEYDDIDARRAAAIEVMIRSGNLHNPRNEVSHRYSHRNARHANATRKLQQARTEREELEDAEQALIDAQARLKLLRAEVKSNSSGRAPPARKGKKARSKLSDSNATTSKDSGHGVASQDDAMVTNDVSAADAEPQASSSRKRAGSESVQVNAPPKRLKTGHLKGWGVDRLGVQISAVKFAEEHWDEFCADYPELVPLVLEH